MNSQHTCQQHILKVPNERKPEYIIFTWLTRGDFLWLKLYLIKEPQTKFQHSKEKSLLTRGFFLIPIQSTITWLFQSVYKKKKFKRKIIPFCPRLLAPSHESSCTGLHMCKCPGNKMQEYQKQPINIHLLNNSCCQCWCKLLFYVIKNLLLYSWTDLSELLAGELFQLRRFSDLVLSFVLEFLPLILQVVRYASTAVDKKVFSLFIQTSGGKIHFLKC